MHNEWIIIFFFFFFLLFDVVERKLSTDVDRIQLRKRFFHERISTLIFFFYFKQQQNKKQTRTLNG